MVKWSARGGGGGEWGGVWRSPAVKAQLARTKTGVSQLTDTLYCQKGS